MKVKVVAAAVAGVLVGGALAAPVSAGQPAERACLGEFFSASAQEFGAGFGSEIVFFAQNADLVGIRNLGEGIQNLQAGTAPGFPEVCQPN